MDAFNLLLEMKLKRRRERPNLPRTVTELVAEDGSRVYVVGTAHFSDDSKRDVVKVSCHPSPGRATASGCSAMREGSGSLLCTLPLQGQAGLFQTFSVSHLRNCVGPGVAPGAGPGAGTG